VKGGFERGALEGSVCSGRLRAWQAALQRGSVWRRDSSGGDYTSAPIPPPGPFEGDAPARLVQ